MDDGGADKFVPDSRDLHRLKAAASNCRGCGLYREANQTVFGNGKKAATLMLVGEQPGDQEDNAGKPFVGLAGKLLQHRVAHVACMHLETGAQQRARDSQTHGPEADHTDIFRHLKSVT